jgi:hypothetical protein
VVNPGFVVHTFADLGKQVQILRTQIDLSFRTAKIKAFGLALDARSIFRPRLAGKFYRLR